MVLFVGFGQNAVVDFLTAAICTRTIFIGRQRNLGCLTELFTILESLKIQN